MSNQISNHRKKLNDTTRDFLATIPEACKKIKTLDELIDFENYISQILDMNDKQKNIIERNIQIYSANIPANDNTIQKNKKPDAIENLSDLIKNVIDIDEALNAFPQYTSKEDLFLEHEKNLLKLLGNINNRLPKIHEIKMASFKDIKASHESYFSLLTIFSDETLSLEDTIRQLAATIAKQNLEIKNTKTSNQNNKFKEKIDIGIYILEKEMGDLVTQKNELHIKYKFVKNPVAETTGRQRDRHSPKFQIGLVG